MNIFPSAFRSSPPPKPPRRRNSEQLLSSSIDSCTENKNNDPGKLISVNSYAFEENNYDSLPSDWMGHNCYKTKQFILSKNESDCVFQLEDQHRNNYKHFQSIQKNQNAANIKLNYSSDIRFKNIMQNKISNALDTDSQTLDKLNCEIALENSCIIQDKQESMYVDNGQFLNVLNAFTYKHRRRHNSDPFPFSKKMFHTAVDKNEYKFKSPSLERESLLEFLPLAKSMTLHYFPNLTQRYEMKCLYKEIKVLNEINYKLWQKLCSSQKCLENFSEETITGISVSDLLSSIYESQKARDKAMEDRIDFVLKQRNDATRELEELIQTFVKGFCEKDTVSKIDQFTDKETKDLLREIELTTNPSKLLQQQSMLLACLHRVKELKQDNTFNQLNTSLKKKESLHEKVQLLETKLSEFHRCNNIWNSDSKYWEDSLLNIISQVFHISSNDHMSFTSSTDYSNNNKPFIERCGKALNVENVLRQLGDRVIENEESIPTEKHIYLREECSLSPKTDSEKEESIVLQKLLQVEIRKREAAEQNCLRLERLIAVLQKKISGCNIGILV